VVYQVVKDGLFGIELGILIVVRVVKQGNACGRCKNDERDAYD
jgi:hypothetical protein